VSPNKFVRGCFPEKPFIEHPRSKKIVPPIRRCDNSELTPRSTPSFIKMEKLLNAKIRKSSKLVMKFAINRTTNPSSQSMGGVAVAEAAVIGWCDDDAKTLVLADDANEPSLKLSRSLTERLKAMSRGCLFPSNASSAVTTPREEISEADLLDPDNRAWV